jgi:predicted ATPase
MTKESISIYNFGPISEVELDDISPLLVLIGPSGSGKSTVLKLLSIFRWIYKRACIKTFLKKAGVKKLGRDTNFKSLLKTSGIDEYLKPNTQIIYTRGETKITFNAGKLNSGNILVPAMSCEKIAFISDKRSIIADYLDHKIERRSAGYYLQDTIDNFMAAKEIIRKMDLDYLGVTFKVEKSNNETKYRFYSIDNEANVRMSAGSSGMQTVTPLCMIAEYFAQHFNPVKAFSESLWKYLSELDKLSEFSSGINVGDIAEKNVHLLVEEPELNLDPYGQIQLVDQLVGICFGGKSDYNMSLSLATHSPYILNYLNLLIQRQLHNAEGVKLGADKISAYEICAGTSNNLKIEVAANRPIVNAVSMSEPLSDIYAEYNRLAKSE